MNSSPLQDNNTNCLCERLGDNYFYYSYAAYGHFTFVSSGITRLLGYSKEEFLKHYSTYLTDAPCNGKVDEYTEKVLTGSKQAIYEIEIYKKDQTICWLEVNETPVFNDARQVIAIEGIARDISEYKKNKKALQHALGKNKYQHRLQTALNAVDAGVFSYDIVNDKIWWDTKSYELFSVDPKSYQNTYNSWRALVYPEDLNDVEKKLIRH